MASGFQHRFNFPSAPADSPRHQQTPVSAGRPAPANVFDYAAGPSREHVSKTRLTAANLAPNIHNAVYKKLNAVIQNDLYLVEAIQALGPRVVGDISRAVMFDVVQEAPEAGIRYLEDIVPSTPSPATVTPPTEPLAPDSVPTSAFQNIMSVATQGTRSMTNTTPVKHTQSYAEFQASLTPRESPIQPAEYTPSRSTGHVMHGDASGSGVKRRQYYADEPDKRVRFG